MPSEALRFDIFAKDEFSKSFNKLTNKLPSIKTVALAAAGGVSALGASLFAIAKTTATAYDEIGKFSQQTGLSTKFLSEMKVAASFTDVNLRTMNKSLERLQVGIGEANKGIGLAKQTFKDLGIELHKENGQLKTTQDMLPELADRFQAMTSATERTEAAQKLFGQRGIEMVKILKDGSEGLKNYAKEAEEMGLIVDEQAAANAAKFNDALFKVKGTLTGLRNETAERVIPIITGLAEKFSDFAKNNRDKILDFGNAVFQAMAGIVEKMTYGVGLIVDSWRGLQMTWEVLKIGMNELAKYMVVSIDWIIEKMVGLMEAINFRGVFDEEIARAQNWSETMKTGIETLQESADAARDNLQELVNTGMATEKIDEFIEKTHLAIETIREAGEAEVEVAMEKNEHLAELSQEQIDYYNSLDHIRVEDVKKNLTTEERLKTQSLMRMASVGKIFGKEVFRMSQAAGIADATINTFRAVMNAKANIPYPWSIAAAAGELIFGMAQVANIAGQKYAAHGGMTNVPREQTMLIDKGERILSPNQNRDFTEFISGGGAAGGGVTVENINVLPNATNAELLLNMNQRDWIEIVETNILPALKTLDNRGFAVA